MLTISIIQRKKIRRKYAVFYDEMLFSFISIIKVIFLNWLKKV